MYIVYETTNLINGKYYIGVHHINESNYLGSGNLIKKAINKYGKENFIRETLKEFNNHIDAYNYEKSIVDLKIVNNFNCYNIMEGGRNPPTIYGKKHTDESKKKMSKAQKGKKHTEETKKKISDNHAKAWLGRKHTKETKKKISEGNKNKKISDETKKRISKAQKGKKHTEETKKKMSKSRKGKKASNETKKIMSKSQQQFIYYIEGNIYTTSFQAAKELNVSYGTIQYWCKNKNKSNCYREKI